MFRLSTYRRTLKEQTSSLLEKIKIRTQNIRISYRSINIIKVRQHILRISCSLWWYELFSNRTCYYAIHLTEIGTDRDYSAFIFYTLVSIVQKTRWVVPGNKNLKVLCICVMADELTHTITPKVVCIICLFYIHEFTTNFTSSM